MIGLLQCDHVLPEFTSIAGDYDTMFRRWLPTAGWRVYDLPAGEFPADADECSGYVTTGSRRSVYEPEPWIERFASLVRSLYGAGKPFFGVCFGHQMIGHALGGRVCKSERGWGIGVHTFEVQRREPWMEPPLDSVGVLMSCQDQIEELPPGAVVLAGNRHCPVGLFRCGSLVGLQGHPEFPPEYAAALMRARRERIGSERVDEALRTLNHPVHTKTLAEWAVRFLTTFEN